MNKSYLLFITSLLTFSGIVYAPPRRIKGKGAAALEAAHQKLFRKEWAGLSENPLEHFYSRVRCLVDNPIRFTSILDKEIIMLQNDIEEMRSIFKDLRKIYDEAKDKETKEKFDGLMTDALASIRHTNKAIMQAEFEKMVILKKCMFTSGDPAKKWFTMDDVELALNKAREYFSDSLPPIELFGRAIAHMLGITNLDYFKELSEQDGASAASAAQPKSQRFQQVEVDPDIEEFDSEEELGQEGVSVSIVAIEEAHSSKESEAELSHFTKVRKPYAVTRTNIDVKIWDCKCRRMIQIFNPITGEKYTGKAVTEYNSSQRIQKKRGDYYHDFPRFIINRFSHAFGVVSQRRNGSGVLDMVLSMRACFFELDEGDNPINPVYGMINITCGGSNGKWYHKWFEPFKKQIFRSE
ncbi:hypothetical protein KAW80_01375 [Candidatus Babeliales bacterium]|nr:hypothetical protein [Candidatus Babeliales bacterium]